jgi:integrase
LIPQRLLAPSQLALFARHDKKAGNNILPISRWTAANIIHQWTMSSLPPDIRADLTAQGITISPQTFRHYFVITVLQRTGDIAETQYLARHADTATTRRYLPYTQSD